MTTYSTPLVVPNIIEQPQLPRPLLPHHRPNLFRRQHKSHPALRVRRAQLQRPAMVRSTQSMVVIPRIACRKVQDLAPGPGKILAAALACGFNRCRRARGYFEHAVDRFWQRVAREAPGREDQLAVGVEVDEAADAGASCREFRGEAVDGVVLRRIAWGQATVGLPARIGSGATFWRLGIPFKDPVAVVISA